MYNSNLARPKRDWRDRIAKGARAAISPCLLKARITLDVPRAEVSCAHLKPRLPCSVDVIQGGKGRCRRAGCKEQMNEEERKEGGGRRARSAFL